MEGQRLEMPTHISWKWIPNFVCSLWPQSGYIFISRNFQPDEIIAGSFQALILVINFHTTLCYTKWWMSDLVFVNPILLQAENARKRMKGAERKSWFEIMRIKSIAVLYSHTRVHECQCKYVRLHHYDVISFQCWWMRGHSGQKESYNGYMAMKIS